ncbi:MAG: UDP-N-acetylmuramate--alanine ligase [Chloroflexi bacterium]|nr:MAG: UDP-N-acetylmuramate--alanine ligase [Chloroflexota bacterium]
MKHIHLIGIGGTGISSIARVLLEKGYIVSGSDHVLSPLALELKKVGVAVYEGHAPQNIRGADLVVRSSAILDDNVEVQAAHKLNIPVLKRSDFLGRLMKENTGIAIAGSHGKTTTSALMAWSLYRLGLDPSYILGGVSKNLGVNAHAGSGNYFVIEADEYDRMFLGLSPDVILITNVEYDHPDCFPTLASYVEAFQEFIKRLNPGGLMLASYESVSKLNLFDGLPESTKAFTYGLEEKADYQAVNLKQNGIGGFTFDIIFSTLRQPITSVSLQIPGEHNVRNALGVVGIHHQLGTNVQDAAQSLAEFKGTGRRFDVVGEVDGITIVDDYAHHPSKVRATLAAARSRYPGRRLVAVWQPHTYSRTRALATDFIQSLVNADQIIVSEIYASREKPENYSSYELVQKMDQTKAHYIAGMPEISEYLVKNLLPGDVLLVLSAGDADQICKTVLTILSERKG